MNTAATIAANNDTKMTATQATEFPPSSDGAGAFVAVAVTEGVLGDGLLARTKVNVPVSGCPSSATIRHATV